MPDEREIGSIDIRLIRQALDVNAANLALGHEVFFAAGAQFVRNGPIRPSATRITSRT